MHSTENIQDDYGTIYVREKGELRCVSNTIQAEDVPSYRRIKPFRLFERGFSVKLCIENVVHPTGSKRKEHFVFAYTKEGNLRYSVKSLFDISLLFIAENVQYVDSLIGFPEQMAERLFTAAEEKHKFSDAETGHKALRLFSEAYGDLVLKSLCLRGRFLLVSEKLEAIKVFHNLQSLDLFGCKIGDNHEILPHLTSEALSSLAQLFLGQNFLSERGLRKLTAPVRVMKRGLGNLQLLDLSYNPISEQAFKYLSCFPNLKWLDISGTDVKSSASVHQILHDSMGLVLSGSPLKDFCHSHCKTQGWAEQVVEQWEVCISDLSKQRKDLKERKAALRFYGREKFVREKLTDSSSRFDKDDDKREWLHFYKPELANQSRHSGNTGCPTTLAVQNQKKRALDSEDCNDSRPPEKRCASHSFTMDDWDLLNSY